jgi:hypothetical protein
MTFPASTPLLERHRPLLTKGKYSSKLGTSPRYVTDKTFRLSYTAFGVGASAPGALSLQASSKPNFAFAPYLLVDPLATPEISSSYSGSKVVSFDMESIASGCYAATEQGAVAPPISCTIRYTGTKVSGEEVTFDAVFEVKNLNVLGVALAGQDVQAKRFPPTFKGLTSLKPNILTAALPAIDGVTAQMGFDDLVYTAYVKK